MTADTNKEARTGRISEDDRLHYIGFEVFPGKPKDLFRSDAEKEQLVQQVKAKRSKGEILREQCTLLEERLSKTEKYVLSVACVVAFLALFLPWYSAYRETVTAAAPTSTSQSSSPQAGTTTNDDEGELITAGVARTKVTRVYETLTGVGSLVAIGSVGGYLFSSGFGLMLTAILMLVYTLTCVALPAYTLYCLWTIKGTSADDVAVKLKNVLKYSWAPVGLLGLVIVLSFLGASYGFDASKSFTSIGTSYGIGALVSTLSYGLPVSLAGFLLLALKGVEI